MQENLNEERERLYSRLCQVRGLEPMPSIGAWILVNVDDPADLARKVNRRVAPGTVSVPRQVKSAVRIPVRTPRENEQLFQIVRELMQARFPRSRRVVG
jgi:histidinol-phosphate/aromatic aminotransferase/cobyric acid decarboxylase-like protein